LYLRSLEEWLPTRCYKYFASNEAKKIPKIPKYQNFHIANREPLIATRIVNRQSEIGNA